MRALQRLVVSCCCALAAWSAAAAEFELEAGQRALSVPNPVTPETPAVDTIAVELNGYDISAFARVEGEHIALELASPLPAGDHSLVVVAFFASGEIETLAEHRLAVFAAPGVKHQALSYDLLLANSYRVAQKADEDFRHARHLNTQGGVSLRGERGGERWLSRSELDVLYDNQPHNNASQREFDLPYYRLEGSLQTDWAALGLTVGNHQVQADNLLFEQFNRRGISATAQSPSQLSKAQLFAMNSEVITRADEDVVLADGEHRSVGAVASVAPISSHPQWLQFGAGYIDGEGGLTGVGVASDDSQTRYGGDAWNVSTDSWFFQRGLWLHLEYAESEFDSDGLEQGAAAETDDAYQGVLQLSSQGGWRVPGLDSWRLLYQHQQVGLYFYSMGNLGLPGDRELDRWLTQAVSGGLTLDLAYEDEHNDVDDDPTRARQATERQQLNLSYAWVDLNPAAGPWRWLGMPSLRGWYHRTERSQSRADGLLAGFHVDDVNYDATLGLDFSAEQWSWGVQHSYLRFRDHSEPLIDDGWLLHTPQSATDNRVTDLYISYYPSQYFSLSPYAQWSELAYEATGDSYKDSNFGFDASAHLLPNKLIVNASYGLQRNRAEIDDPTFFDSDFKSQLANISVQWRVLEARPLRPGLDVYLRGSYNRQKEHAERSDFADEMYQVLIGFDLRWSKGA